MTSFFSSAKYAIRRVACASSVVVGSGCSGVISECSFVIPGALGKWCQGWGLISCFVCCLVAARPTDDSAQGPEYEAAQKKRAAEGVFSAAKEAPVPDSEARFLA